ncbi:MAG TPA: aldo/keto reductase [Acidimicrobiales bacterium]|nr:aldo/keto reductase [Acidimicrobiales bacterium]
MLTRTLGRTGHESSVAILGGAAFARCAPEEAAVGFAAALDAGVNHLDIAPQYGEAQRNVGPLLTPDVRARLFVACKTLRKNADGVRAQLEESLALLQCERFDLYQLHAVTDLDELDARSAAAASILRARDEGLTRFVGVTGHNLTTPAAQTEALRRYDLDTVMFPVYPRVWADPDYRRDAEALLELCAERNVGVMAIKAAAARPWTVPPVERSATTWYEPQTSAEAIRRGVGFALSTSGVHAFCTPGDLDVLRLALEAAASFDGPLSDDERARAMDAVAGDDVIFPIPA